MIQPPIIGPIVPPILNPVVTMPTPRPNAPGGEAARTSMSREGEIMPDMNPAQDIAATMNTGPRSTVPTIRISTPAQPNPPAATSPWRFVASAMKPPASTPTAVANRNPVNAALAAEKLTPYIDTSATAE